MSYTPSGSNRNRRRRRRRRPVEQQHLSQPRRCGEKKKISTLLGIEETF
jgi:hypothetical protein